MQWVCESFTSRFYTNFGRISLIQFYDQQLAKIHSPGHTM